ncbi:DUF4350 domain-containing protein [Maribacter sp. HTCC2170]|uniref:DUF4350 domain-containing protein n=1 Tax=Maribacter sp. (strain HTCC2170 / KCCM 42371) TaxID=313603 RepID=UPI00006B47DB|nr:DUF4350 domain-containing protein [Maribacter sp. HTCC2170]EAR01955.1 hypothetical protein FB2170_15543 [Maribacter sp. HTCC2170]
MRKKGTIYIVIALVTLAFLMLFQYGKPKEVNWFPSFVSQHKIPYGTYVLNDLMKKKYGKNLRQVQRPPFELLQSDSTINGTYLFVNNRVSFGEAEMNSLLYWTSKGNTLFIASGAFEHELQDTLNFETSGLYADFGEKQKQKHKLVHSRFKNDGFYEFKKDNYATYFSKIDTLNAIIIGQVDYEIGESDEQAANFNIIKQPFGDGEIILSTFPKAFTNYFLLENNNKDYTAGLLSYIDDSKPIYMDNHYKSGKSFYTSPMYIFLNTKEFKWAYYIVLIGALLYVIFEGKRKQRAIPVVTPLKNQTLAFTRTIADMYFKKGEQKSITDHKIAYFLEYIRSHFHLNTLKRDDGFFHNLASRSNHSYDEIKELFSYMEKLKIRSVIKNHDLQKLNTLIEKFKLKADGK